MTPDLLLLVVLAETGRTKDGLPVYTRHPAPVPIVQSLTRGFSGRLLRMYSDRGWGPAYLLLSDNEGGFPRYGFVLDGEVRRDEPFVDLHRRSTLTGRFGAVDQIYPHELLHIFMRRLAGSAPRGGANQVHAIGVRTDLETAFAEGFAEHAQIMAVDDPEASPETAALRSAARAPLDAQARLEDYRRALERRWRLAARPVMAFPLWFGQTEQVLRYHAVRDNLFAREPEIAARLVASADPYPAYLLSNLLPGTPSAPRKSASRALATEGVVAHFFWRLATDAGITGPYEKIFETLRKSRPYETISFIRAYTTLYPHDAGTLERIVIETFGAEPGVRPEIWLRNTAFSTGTTLYDQWRALPRPHTFDLNAASLVDLMTVPGMTMAEARAVLAAAPYVSIDDLRRVKELQPMTHARLTSMGRTTPGSDSRDEFADLSLLAILTPYAQRALAWWILASVAAAWVMRRLRRLSWIRGAANGGAVSFAVLAAGWTITPPSTGIVASLLLFAVPPAIVAAWRQRSLSAAARVTLSWVLAAAPALALMM